MPSLPLSPSLPCLPKYERSVTTLWGACGGQQDPLSVFAIGRVTKDLHLGIFVIMWSVPSLPFWFCNAMQRQGVAKQGPRGVQTPFCPLAPTWCECRKPESPLAESEAAETRCGGQSRVCSQPWLFYLARHSSPITSRGPDRSRGALQTALWVPPSQRVGDWLTHFAQPRITGEKLAVTFSSMKCSSLSPPAAPANPWRFRGLRQSSDSLPGEQAPGDGGAAGLGTTLGCQGTRPRRGSAPVVRPDTKKSIFL